ncbi:MAG: hypothetical protein M1813_003344 [Trichoglossum hirsutum]|nr:MAG: hypothetical protein M1813_003344 [Trichoglossum hirsutum]
MAVHQMRIQLLLVFVSALFLLIFFSTPNHKTPSTLKSEHQSGGAGSLEKELVVASLKEEDTLWIGEFFPDWRTNIYVVNDPSAPVTVPKNKGREAMVYLTYIISRYETLPDVVVFTHSLRYQWHNEDPMYDGVPVLRSLQLNHVKERGYVSLRCTWALGCPAELRPLKPTANTDYRSQSEAAYASVFRVLFPGTPVPEVVGAHCSSQFAVSRERVRERSKSEYKRIRDWLLATELDDQISGRVLEYSWHINGTKPSTRAVIMQMPPVDCQPAGECFCQAFGLCNLTCTEGSCGKRYKLPQYSTIPDGWPEKGAGENGWPALGWND